MLLYFLSTTKKFSAWATGGQNEYKILRRQTKECVGWIRLFDNKTPLGRWMFDPLLTPLSGFDLMEISGLVGMIRENSQETPIDNNEF